MSRSTPRANIVRSIGNTLSTRRDRRRCWRKARAAAVCGLTALSLAAQQTGAYAAVEMRIREPARISLRPGMWAAAADSLHRAMTNLARSASGLVAGVMAGDGPPVMPAPGQPYPWQAADPGIPFSTINLAN